LVGSAFFLAKLKKKELCWFIEIGTISINQLYWLARLNFRALLNIFKRENRLFCLG